MVPCNIGEINQVVLNLIVNGAHAIRDQMRQVSKVKSKYQPSIILPMIVW